eukprot:TRINITY_DN7482_c0_g1_i2.p2 TRINITY_DN7482_c0_g1~~TRINITY_DN7482_c0_g1_i2.p2  ORF type:complete len:103 (-),score=6.56 TRINITY_DN7482_c0_g1_i2:272-580(-)
MTAALLKMTSRQTDAGNARNYNAPAARVIILVVHIKTQNNASVPPGMQCVGSGTRARSRRCRPLSWQQRQRLATHEAARLQTGRSQGKEQSLRMWESAARLG